MRRPRHDDEARQATGNRGSGGDVPRDRYRDDDDQRDRLDGDERLRTSPDTRNEAQESARVNVGNTAHGQKDRDLEDRD